MDCPKCGLRQPDSSRECFRCGVIFAKIGAPDLPATPPHGVDAAGHFSPRSNVPARPHSVTTVLHGQSATPAPAGGPSVDTLITLVSSEAVAAEALVEGPPEVRHLDRSDWLVLASGPVAALLIMCVPLLDHIFMTFMILTHEMGHAIVGWLFGYPSLPAFDLRYGGGVTATLERSWLLLSVEYAFVAFLLYTYRRNIATLIVLSVFLVLHIVIASTDLHNLVFLFMGHGTELVIAAIFFYRALSGAAVIHEAERPLYSLISWFIVFTDIRFAFRLMTSAHERRMYEIAKGGGHWMDFSRIADDHLNVTLVAVATFFFVCCFAPLIVGFLAFRYQEFLRVLVTRLWAREPGLSGSAL